jgi:hypothetical protein
MPVFLAIVAMAAYVTLNIKPTFFGVDGFITYISDILKFLSPFYIASLAAVAIFSGDTIDGEMPGKPFWLNVKIEGAVQRKKLSRRQLLSLMFGYLSLSSLFLYFIGYIGNIAAVNLHTVCVGWLYLILKYVFMFVYLFCFFNLLVTTMYGLFYLSYRIHSDD